MPELSTQEIVDELSRIFAEEVEASVRYLHLANAVRGLERRLVEPILKEAYEETVQHAEVIARKIRSLGRVPHLKVNVACPPEPIAGRTALRIALDFEEAALEAYRDLLGRIEGDVQLEEFIRTQVAVESEHVAQLKELLDEV